jgi:hypothetical protein
VAFWIAGAGALLLEQEELSLAPLLFCGALLGLGFFGKLTAIFGLVAIVLAFVGSRASRAGRGSRLARELGLLSAAALLAGLPFLARNLFATGNPVFPWFNEIFHSPRIGPAVGALPEVTAAGFFGAGSFALEKLERLAAESPLAWAAPLFLFAVALDRRLRKYAPIFTGLAISYALALAWPVQGGFQIRWIGLSLILAGATGGVAVSGLLEAIVGTTSKIRPTLLPKLRFLMAAVLSLALGWQVFEHTLWDTLFSGKPANELILSSRDGFIAGDAKAWLRKNARQDDVIVSTADNQFYYLAHLRSTNLFTDGSIDSYADRMSPARIVEFLRERGGTLLLDTLFWGYLQGKGVTFWGKYSRELQAVIFEHPETIRFAGDLAIVVDLRALDDALHERCMTHPEPENPAL